MTLFHCPETFARKPHGCGKFGPVNATRAFLDYGGLCPRCKAPLKADNRPRFSKPATPPKRYKCAALGVTGVRYCNEYAHEGAFCKRHREAAYC